MCGPVGGVRWESTDGVGREVCMCGPVGGVGWKSTEKGGGGMKHGRGGLYIEVILFLLMY